MVRKNDKTPKFCWGKLYAFKCTSLLDLQLTKMKEKGYKKIRPHKYQL
jgi:hypothetical protein